LLLLGWRKVKASQER